MVRPLDFQLQPMGAGRTMKRNVRFAAVFLLAGLVQVALSGVVSAQNTPWKFFPRIDPVTDKVSGHVVSVTTDRSIAFACQKGEPVEVFFAEVETGVSDGVSGRDVEVAWRTDDGAVRNEIWKASEFKNQIGGVEIAGQSAFEFALAVARAQNRVVFRDPNGTLVYDAKGSTKAISQMLEFCGLEQ